MKTKDAIKHLATELVRDKNFRQTWKSTITISFLDCHKEYKKETKNKNLSERDIIIIANNSAEHFLEMLCSLKN
jgi:hypothetical protein